MIANATITVTEAFGVLVCLETQRITRSSGNKKSHVMLLLKIVGRNRAVQTVEWEQRNRLKSRETVLVFLDWLELQRQLFYFANYVQSSQKGGGLDVGLEQ